MVERRLELADGRTLLIRTAIPQDAPAVLEYVDAISGESDFLSFGPCEFGLTVAQERETLREYQAADNQLALLGSVDGSIVSMVTFAAGRRPRNRHTGEFGLSVRRLEWGRGIGTLMLDTLIEWAKTTHVVTKINLRVRTDNHRAIALYERKGFVREGTIHQELFVGGAYFDHHWMGLTL
jgi:RimJ/RimL family protein N-acetyltransferase